MTTKQVKKDIIDNYIDWFTSDEDEREQMKENANLYVEEDHVDEIGQSFPLQQCLSVILLLTSWLI